ncbi:hypothetical protein FSP39_003631 [Pinctada imbricata]|uniref:C3H1-type domain-containing protein n=1 Tax=Pinctada imbricata TaxID=66713 RepID=A0AA88YHE4_PINIB|nr:hypothetical protein FSP39_003631 [Pinctada imbricata]
MGKSKATPRGTPARAPGRRVRRQPAHPYPVQSLNSTPPSSRRQWRVTGTSQTAPPQVDFGVPEIPGAEHSVNNQASGQPILSTEPVQGLGPSPGVAPQPFIPDAAPSSGNEHSSLSDNSVSAMSSIFDNVGEHVPLKLKEKIWNGQFIDLSLLLKSARDMTSELESGGEVILKDGKLLVQKHKSTKPLFNIHAWTSAFLVYMSLYLEKHPSRVQEMLKYMRDVRLAASRAPNQTAWVRYDEQFRLKRANNPQSSWGIIDNELWLVCMSNFRGENFFRGEKPNSNFQPHSQPTLDTDQKSVVSSTSKQICWRFNKGNCRFNRNCNFQHRCSTCGSNHPVFKCTASKPKFPTN